MRKEKSHPRIDLLLLSSPLLFLWNKQINISFDWAHQPTNGVSHVTTASSEILFFGVLKVAAAVGSNVTLREDSLTRVHQRHLSIS